MPCSSDKMLKNRLIYTDRHRYTQTHTNTNTHTDTHTNTQTYKVHTGRQTHTHTEADRPPPTLSPKENRIPHSGLPWTSEYFSFHRKLPL